MFWWEYARQSSRILWSWPFSRYLADYLMNPQRPSSLFFEFEAVTHRLQPSEFPPPPLVRPLNKHSRLFSRRGQISARPEKSRAGYPLKSPDVSLTSASSHMEIGLLIIPLKIVSEWPNQYPIEWMWSMYTCGKPAFIDSIQFYCHSLLNVDGCVRPATPPAPQFHFQLADVFVTSTKMYQETV